MLIVDAIIISRYRSVGTRSRKSIGTSVSSKDNWSSDKLISAASFSDGGLVRCHRTPWSSSRCIAIVPYEDEKKKGATPVSFRHPCDLIVYSTALFFLLSSLFRPRSLSVIFFFFFQKEQRRTKRSGGEEARFRRSLRVNRWKSGLPSHHREREARSLRKVRDDRSIGSKEFISDIYAKRSTYFKRVPNESIIERNIMAHCSRKRSLPL